jgi:PKD repeat protein
MTPALASAGQALDFSAHVIGGSGGPVAVAWHFGDGATSTRRTTTHVYTAGGAYDVKVLAREAGTTAAAREQLYVRDFPAALSGRELRGQVLVLEASPPGAPLASHPAAKGMSLALSNSASTTTASNGLFRFKNLGSGRPTLTALDGNGHLLGTSHNIPLGPDPSLTTTTLDTVPAHGDYAFDGAVATPPGITNPTTTLTIEVTAKLYDINGTLVASGSEHSHSYGHYRIIATPTGTPGVPDNGTITLTENGTTVDTTTIRTNTLVPGHALQGPGPTILAVPTLQG